MEAEGSIQKESMVGKGEKVESLTESVGVRRGRGGRN